MLGQMEDSSTTALPVATHPSIACLHLEETTLGRHAANSQHYLIHPPTTAPCPIPCGILSDHPASFSNQVVSGQGEKSPASHKRPQCLVLTAQC